MPAKILDVRAYLITRSRTSSGGCIEFQGAKTSGYGYVNLGGRNYLTHRLAWMLYKGEIPKGMNVCHHCDNPPCMNIDHGSSKEIAERFGISRQNVAGIKFKRIWKHIHI